MIEKLKSSKESNSKKETIGEKLSQVRDKINEIIDYINENEEMKVYSNSIDLYLSELLSENLSSEDIIIESEEQ